jgi:hypothetical protein
LIGFFGYIGFANCTNILVEHAKGLIFVGYGYPPNKNGEGYGENFTIPTYLVRFSL